MDSVRHMTRWIKRYWAILVRGLLVAAFLMMAISAITLDHYNRVLGQSEIMLWLTTALISVGPELAGIVIGVVSIDLLNERRQREEHKRRLIRELASPHNEIAIAAARELREEGWLTRTPGLKGVNLSRADLTSADLSEAQLEGVNLQAAKLNGANLKGANLQRANLQGIEKDISHETYGDISSPDGITPEGLWRTELQAAELMRADLRTANLRWADLYLANMCGANLEGAILEHAILEKANFEGANLCGVDLTGVFVYDRFRDNDHYIRVYLEGAVFDAMTKWPDAMDPQSLGARRVASSSDWTAEWLRRLVVMNH